MRSRRPWTTWPTPSSAARSARSCLAWRRRDRHPKGRGHRVVAQADPSHRALLQIVDVALVVGPRVHVEADRWPAELRRILDGVQVRGPIEVPRSAHGGRSHGRHVQGLARDLLVVGEGEGAALDARPAELALVAVNRRARALGPAEHEDFHLRALVNEVTGVAASLEPHVGLERGRFDERRGEQLLHAARIEAGRGQPDDFINEPRHGHERGRRTHGGVLYDAAPSPALGALTSTPMLPYGCLFSSMSWWHSGMSSKPKVCERHGSTLPSATSFVTAAACTSFERWLPWKRF